MANASIGHVYTTEPDKLRIEVATRIHKHAGFADKITIIEGTIQSREEEIVKHCPFDMIFIDHWKDLYLPDLKWL